LHEFILNFVLNFVKRSYIPITNKVEYGLPASRGNFHHATMCLIRHLHGCLTATGRIQNEGG